MKKIFILLILPFFFILSCNHKKNKETTEEKKISKKISKRNYFINKQNACNDFFFDSSSLVNYIKDANLPDSVSRRMTSFYNSRNYQFAWFNSSGVSEQARGFWNMYRYYSVHDTGKITKNKNLVKQMDGLVASEDSVWLDKQAKLLPVELELTEQYLRFYLENIDKGYLKRKEIERFIPAVKANPVALADSLVNKKHKDDKYYADINPAYAGLLQWLGKYTAVYKQGGWPLINMKATALKPGVNGKPVLLLKKRLSLSEDLDTNDTTATWTNGLTEAIKKFQRLHGYKATGVLTDNQLKDLNVPVKERIMQLLVNLGRTQWIIDQPKGKFILVNIPEFLLHVTEDGKKIFDMTVVVGKEGHNTTIFTGTLNQVVFAPYWNIPESIVKNEIMPELSKHPNYLKEHEMETMGKSASGLPVLRQLPGDKNPLGHVKFLFPNSYDIYFHDTPSKSLFSKDKRAFSHGCIRLSEPKKMADWLLQYDSRWDVDKINEAMKAPEEKTVWLKQPVPVLITYYTAWVDEAGMLRFADDIYGHDKVQMARMFK